jgi:hypothetical protein
MPARAVVGWNRFAYDSADRHREGQSYKPYSIRCGLCRIILVLAGVPIFFGYWLTTIALIAKRL